MPGRAGAAPEVGQGQVCRGGPELAKGQACRAAHGLQPGQVDGESEGQQNACRGAAQQWHSTARDSAPHMAQHMAQHSGSAAPTCVADVDEDGKGEVVDAITGQGQRMPGRAHKSWQTACRASRACMEASALGRGRWTRVRGPAPPPRQHRLRAREQPESCTKQGGIVCHSSACDSRDVGLFGAP